MFFIDDFFEGCIKFNLAGYLYACGQVILISLCIALNGIVLSEPIFFLYKDLADICDLCDLCYSCGVAIVDVQ